MDGMACKLVNVCLRVNIMQISNARMLPAHQRVPAGDDGELLEGGAAEAGLKNGHVSLSFFLAGESRKFTSLLLSS